LPDFSDRTTLRGGGSFNLKSINSYEFKFKKHKILNLSITARW
jgi:hypothetical protein